jgi:TBC1 domain family member 8/9
VHRTFKDKSLETEEGIAELRRVLMAYAWVNTDVGYCQSMNFIAATFLLYLDEQETFW